MATRSDLLSTSSRTGDGPCSPNFQDQSGPARAPAALLRDLTQDDLRFLNSLRYPWGAKPVQPVKQLAFLRYSLDLLEQGEPKYLERLLSLVTWPRKWNAIRKGTSLRGASSRRVPCGDQMSRNTD